MFSIFNENLFIIFIKTDCGPKMLINTIGAELDKWYSFYFSFDFKTEAVNFLMLSDDKVLFNDKKYFCHFSYTLSYKGTFSFGNAKAYTEPDNGANSYIKDIFFYKNNRPSLIDFLIKYSYEKNLSNICHANCEKCIGEDFNQCIYCKFGFYLKENKKNFVIGSCENKYFPNFIKSPKLYYTQSHSFLLLTQKKRYFLKNNQIKEQTFNDQLLTSIIYPLDFK